MDLSILIKILIIILLLIASAIFVMFEFALVKLRPTRVNEMAESGNKTAKILVMMVEQLDHYLSATQLGITIVSLGLGWLGESTFHTLFTPMFELLDLNSTLTHTISLVVAFGFMTLLHVVLGELVPKTIAIQSAEKTCLRVAWPMYMIAKVFGFEPASEHDEIHSEQELRTIMKSSREHGQINDVEYRYVEKIFEFDNKIAKEIMTPRTEVEAIDMSDSLGIIMRQLKQEEYTRYPVIEDGDKDEILGILNVKKLLFTDKPLEKTEDLEKYITPAIKVFEHTPISQVLATIKQSREHMIVITDEYGGTSGVVTLEDIVEEITGEIRDEFDNDEQSLIKKLKNGHYLLDGWVPIQDVNALFHVQLPHEEVDTIGAYIYLEKYEAKVGATYIVDKLTFVVRKVEENQIRTLEVWETEEN